MEEITEINKLNKKIIRNNKRIRNLRIRDDVIGFIPMVALAGTVTAVYFKDSDNTIIKEFYPISFYLSLVIGGTTSMHLPTKRTIDKINRYELEIKETLNELRGYALEEDKKRMLKK